MEALKETNQDTIFVTKGVYSWAINRAVFDLFTTLKAPVITIDLADKMSLINGKSQKSNVTLIENSCKRYKTFRGVELLEECWVYITIDGRSDVKRRAFIFAGYPQEASCSS